MDYFLVSNGVRTSTGVFISNDVKNKDWIAYLNWLALGNTAKLDYQTQSVEDTYAQAEAEAQRKLDELAQSWGYDSVVTLVSYVSSSNAQKAADARAMIDYRDIYWDAADAIKAQIISGSISMPATFDAFLALLPAAPSRPSV
jgi:hypothetical protein